MLHVSPSCYFSLSRPTTSTNISSDTPMPTSDYQTCEVVTPDASHPFLAMTPPPLSVSRSGSGSGSESAPVPTTQRPKMDISKLLQMQTQAAHPHAQPVRPQPRPLQDVLHVSDDFSENNSDESIASVDVEMRSPSPDEIIRSPIAHARCSRCHRTPSIDLTTGKHNMIEYGLNSFYCIRCAGMVGFAKR